MQVIPCLIINQGLYPSCLFTVEVIIRDVLSVSSGLLVCNKYDLLNSLFTPLFTWMRNISVVVTEKEVLRLNFHIYSM